MAKKLCTPVISHNFFAAEFFYRPFRSSDGTPMAAKRFQGKKISRPSSLTIFFYRRIFLPPLSFLRQKTHGGRKISWQKNFSRPSSLTIFLPQNFSTAPFVPQTENPWR
jgi:hypothetical protein